MKYKEVITLIGGYDDKIENVPVLYRTKNLVLTRHWASLKRDINTKERFYTITWRNFDGEILRLFDANFKINDIKGVMRQIQDFDVDLNKSSTYLKNHPKFKEFIYSIRYKYLK